MSFCDFDNSNYYFIRDGKIYYHHGGYRCTNDDWYGDHSTPSWNEYIGEATEENVQKYHIKKNYDEQKENREIS